MDCPDLFELIPQIAKAAVDNALGYKIYIYAPDTEVTDELLNLAKVPLMNKSAARRLLCALASISTGGPKTKRQKVQAPRCSAAMNAYHHDAHEEIARLCTPHTFTLSSGKKKTTPAVTMD